MCKNKLIISAAGSGKTTYIAQEALRQKGRILVLTYTQSNEASIKTIFLKEANCIPNNITVQTWFSFLLQHGAKPYQGCIDNSLFEENIKGMLLVNQQSAIRYMMGKTPVYWSEKDYFHKHYFTSDDKIYSDKISKFAVKCNKAAGNLVIDRISRIYSHIFVDEVQDLAGYDLELIKLFFKSPSSILLVGDPRQVTYLTHIERKFDKYKNGRIKEFVASNDCRGIQCDIDETTLNVSHRNNLTICNYSSRLYPNLPKTIPCSCCRKYETDHEGVFLLRPENVESYIKRFDVVQLRWDIRRSVLPDKPVMNFGESKGHTFNRVLIYPTDEMTKWITDNNQKLSDGTRAKFYVALTRARRSVAIVVMDFDKNHEYKGIKQYYC